MRKKASESNIHLASHQTLYFYFKLVFCHNFINVQSDIPSRMYVTSMLRLQKRKNVIDVGSLFLRCNGDSKSMLSNSCNFHLSTHTSKKKFDFLVHVAMVYMCARKVCKRAN